MTILKEAVLAVTNRRGEYEDAEAYYEGNVSEVFGSANLARVFRNSPYRTNLNFCRPVVDAVHNRLEIAAVLGVSDAANAIISATWDRNELFLDANEVHRRTLSNGDYYVMAWPDEEGEIEFSLNSPLTTSIVYDPERPRKKLYAVKMWEQGENTRLNLYYPDRIEKYQTKGTQVSETVQWTRIDSMENPFGEVPVFHFRTLRPFGRPEHMDAYNAQDYINKQFVTSMIVADYQGAPQRYALSQAGTAGEVEDFEEGGTARENVKALKNDPGALWYLDGVHTVGQFSPADPKVFWEPIKDTVRAMASLTNTPLHYFEKTGNVPSGEALRVAEAPLIKKVQDRQISFGQTWRELFKFVLRVNGIDEDVEVKWKDVESLDALELLDAALKKRNAGWSIAQVMREAGYDEKVIERVIAEAKEERNTGDAAAYPRVRATTTADETQVAPTNTETTTKE